MVGLSDAAKADLRASFKSAKSSKSAKQRQSRREQGSTPQAPSEAPSHAPSTPSSRGAPILSLSAAHSSPDLAPSEQCGSIPLASSSSPMESCGSISTVSASSPMEPKSIAPSPSCLPGPSSCYRATAESETCLDGPSSHVLAARAQRRTFGLALSLSRIVIRRVRPSWGRRSCQAHALLRFAVKLVRALRSTIKQV